VRARRAILNTRHLTDVRSLQHRAVILPHDVAFPGTLEFTLTFSENVDVGFVNRFDRDPFFILR
jgi:hypothetical protein